MGQVMTDALAHALAGILVAGVPLVLATLGETLTERAGVINLSLDGTILLAAMSAFAVSFSSNNAWLGLTAAVGVGCLAAAVLAVVSLLFNRSQLAIGFILTLLWRDLAYFLGHPYARQQGAQLPVWTIAGIKDLPFLGVVLGQQTPVVYFSLFLIPFSWWWLCRTRAGLRLRAVGEDPRAAYVRGIWVVGTRILYTLLGGALVGLAGGAYSLAVKPGWGRPQGAEGAGWIALAIVIFGGWHPLRAAFGAYLFAALQVVSIQLQDAFPAIPAPIFQVAPFPVMILTLLLVNIGDIGWLHDLSLRQPWLRRWLQRLQVRAPAALGQDFQPEEDS